MASYMRLLSGGGGSGDTAYYSYGRVTYGTGPDNFNLTNTSATNYYPTVLENANKYTEVNLGFRPKSIAIFPLSGDSGRRETNTVFIFDELQSDQGTPSTLVSTGDYYAFSGVAVKFTDT